jgi:hypothetical protein
MDHLSPRPLVPQGRPAVRRAGLALPLILALCALTACTDGYPPTQREPVEPQLMNTQQLLNALNTMGRRAADGNTWTYRMGPRCELRVSSAGRADAVNVVHPLSQARFDLGYDKALPAFEVRLQRQGDDTPAHPPLLKATDWADAVFARSVLWHLQQDCA